MASVPIGDTNGCWLLNDLVRKHSWHPKLNADSVHSTQIMAILFLHIPKAAGTYVDSCVRQANIRSAHAVSNVNALSAAINAKSSYIAGHFVFEHLTKVAESWSDYKLVTLIRNPIDRFLSDANYHVEILKRGGDFLRKHSDYWQKMICMTHAAIRQSQPDGLVELDHLHDIMLNEYLAMRMLPQSTLESVRSSSVSEASMLIDETLKSYKFVGVIEKGGAGQLLDIVSMELGIDFADSRPNRNASANYISWESIDAKTASTLRSSRVSNLLYLKILGEPIDGDHAEPSWDHVNRRAMDVYMQTSAYMNKPVEKLPDI